MGLLLKVLYYDLWLVLVHVLHQLLVARVYEMVQHLMVEPTTKKKHFLISSFT